MTRVCITKPKRSSKFTMKLEEMTKAVVTGNAAFIGFNLCQELANWGNYAGNAPPYQ